MAATKALGAATGFRAWYRRFMFNTGGYNKYGLKYDDLLDIDSAVTEAIRRLPQKLQDERTYRIYRASYYCTWHRILPEQEWTKASEDDSYLQPYIDEVKREINEREEWDSK
ncbi:hypothetical protein CHUAL_002448 [Chamberlinius hualienensis]